jgi:hypothetical protein
MGMAPTLSSTPRWRSNAIAGDRHQSVRFPSGIYAVTTDRAETRRRLLAKRAIRTVPEMLLSGFSARKAVRAIDGAVRNRRVRFDPVLRQQIQRIR